jgi:hypothetical protein
MTSEGQLLNGRYRLIMRIGSGSQASVWLAEDGLLERRVALKAVAPALAPETAGVEKARARALIEARALARVRHRCVVRIHDIFFAGQDPWIVMEYVSGRSLADIVAAERPDDRVIAAIGHSVLSGLIAVHAAGIVHRDVKPANILVDQDGSVFLVDFGIAKVSDQASAPGHLLDGVISRGQVVGTPEYMAPERLTGHPATPASDLWSLGVTLYFALQGHTPFSRQGPAHAVGHAILYEEPRAPSRPGPLSTVIRDLLRKDPARRPVAAEVIEVLESVLSNGGPLDQTTLTRRALANGTRAASPAGPSSSQARLLDMPPERAAVILSGCSIDVAAQFVADGAMVRADKASELLRMLSPVWAGKILDHVPADAGAALIRAMPPAQRYEMVTRADIRTIAEVLMLLPNAPAAQLIAAMPDDRAARILGHVRPKNVALIVAALSPDQRDRTLGALSPDMRALVRRHQ